CFSSYVSGALRDLPSFPTRRSSDLNRFGGLQADEVVHQCWVGAELPGISLPLDPATLADHRQAIGDVQRQVDVLFGDQDRLAVRSEEHTSELQSRENLVCRLLLEKK